MLASKQFIDIQRYEKAQGIGKGSFGEVFKVVEKSSGNIYAAKVSSISINSNSDQKIINLLREINICSVIDHPAILKYIGYSPIDFDYEEYPVILMEYIKNGSLYNIIKLERQANAPKNWDDTKKLIIIYGIASGMQYLHSNNIIHRDLKPSNILVDDFLFPKICDFGLSKMLHTDDSMTIQSSSGIKGTILYLSPEIIKSNNYTKSGDVYAFGIIVYEIMTNQIPYNGFNEVNIIFNVADGLRPKIEVPIPKAYRNLIEKCWSQNPNDRPTFNDIVDELKKNSEFITETVDKDEYIDYVTHIDNCNSSFDKDKKVINIDNYLQENKNIFILDEMESTDDLNDISSAFYSFFGKDNTLPDNLNDKCQKLIVDSENDHQKQFLIGKYFIKGEKDFPLNIEVGIKFIEKSINGENIDALFYMYDVLQKGIPTPQKLDENEKAHFKIATENYMKKLYHSCLKYLEKELSSEYLFNKLDDFLIEPKIKTDEWFGTIKKCVIKYTNQPVLFNMPLKNCPNEIRSLVQKYQALKKNYHPTIQMPIGLYHPKYSNRFCLITPFYENGNLSEFMDKKGNNLGSLGNLLIFGIALGMSNLHKNGVAHFNLNPNNIFIDEKNYPVLTNFGSSKEQIATKMEVLKDCIYFAPEILKNEEYDQSADVYSFGLLTIYILTGKLPFVSTTLDGMINERTNSQIQFDKKIPSYAKLCLNPNPKKRLTFDKILEQLKSKFYSNNKIYKYFQEIDITSQIKPFFRIPRQIIKLPSKRNPWNLETHDPINWREFCSIFHSNDDKKALLIMTIGKYQSGKSTFLRTITGNQAYYSGTGMSSTTIGLFIDGPYTKSELVDHIYDEDFKEHFDEIDITDETQIFFIDTQGIGDVFYKNISVVLDRIYSAFCSISTICISIVDINEESQALQFIIKIMRKAQFISGSFSKMFFLIKGYEEFDSLDDNYFEALSDFQKDFQIKYSNQHTDIFQYYIRDSIIPLLLGNYKFDLDKYVHSSWYALYYTLSQIEKDNLFSKGKVNYLVSGFSSCFFGPIYLMFYTDILSIEETLSESSDIMKRCTSCIYAITNCISNILEISQIPDIVDELTSLLMETFSVFRQFLLPLFLGDFDISYLDFKQYAYELSCDINSFFKSNLEYWKYHMRLESNATKAFFGPISWTPYIPLIGFGIMSGFLIYKIIQRSKRNNIKKSITPSMFPFIWDKNLIQFKKKEFKIEKINGIIKRNDYLIIFYDQNNNDSSLIFRALTGVDVNYKSKNQVSEIFLNVPIKALMKRFTRFGKIHSSSLENANVNFIYLKGCSQENISFLCQTQTRKTIFISSIIENQTLNIRPTNDDCLFYLFYLSLNCYDSDIVNKKLYLQNLKSQKIENIKQSLNLTNGDILVIQSNNYEFDKKGPIAHALIKYGCRFALQDISLIPNNQ